jgi:AraC-like DNA-binding protein
MSAPSPGVDKPQHERPQMAGGQGDLRRPIRPLLVLDVPALDFARELPPPYDVRPLAGWDALAESMAGAAPSALALVDPYAGASGVSPHLRELLARHPSVPVVAAVPPRPEGTGDVQALLEAGVSEIVDLGLERSVRTLWARLRAAHARPLKRRLEAELPCTSGAARHLLRAAAEVAVDGGGTAELARRFGAAPRAASAWCAREGLPAPRRLNAWMRVLLAAMLLEEPGRSVLGAARASGYATDHALRRALRTLVSADPATHPRDRLFAPAAARFNAELRACRERARERKKARRARV